jgi:D-glycero-beta-D-manno-heptose-7-phosphate kinase
MSSKTGNNSWLPALDLFKKARVLVVGDVMHDVFIWGRVGRISPEAPVPVVEVTRETALLGGAANVVANLVALGARAALAGVIGKDRAGDAVLAELDALGVDRGGVVRSPLRPTPVKTRVIAHHQQVVRFDREDKCPLRPGTAVALWRSLSRTLPRVDAVIVSDYAKGVISAELMARLVASCAARGIVLAVDPKPEHRAWYRGATLVTPNHKEASEMAGFELDSDPDLQRGGRAILDALNLRAVLITRGEKGMSLFQPGRPALHVPTHAREVYDVTGAGDTVIAALTLALAAGLDLPDAVAVANVAAGIVVAKLGTSVATLPEIKAAVHARRK